MEKLQNSALATYPSVYAIGNEYHIMVYVKEPTTMWVRVNGKNYYDHSNGILKSDSFVHKMIVPMCELDEQKSYTICYRKMVERKPYYSETGEIEELTFKFFPFVEGDIKIYHISDAHNRIKSPISAAGFLGEEIDLLILNGDIPDHSGDINNFKAIYEISGAITKGEKPVIFSRGNHDMRGIYAEKFADYTPVDKGVSYFTVRLGDLWCLVLDTGEDKSDDSVEYGNTICCHEFRLDQTKFIKNVINNAQNEYSAKGVNKKIVICHNPFTIKERSIFDIENDIYDEWVELIRTKIDPDFYICGHKHACKVIMPNDEEDARNQGVPVIIGSKPTHGDESLFEACAITYENGKIKVTFTNQDKEVTGEKIL